MMNDRDANPFEILEVTPGAPRHEIDRAYELALLSYGEDSLASYSLFSPRERMAMIHRIERAYRVLTDPSVQDATPAAPRDIPEVFGPEVFGHAERREAGPDAAPESGPAPENALPPPVVGVSEERSTAALVRASLNRHKPLPARPAVEPIDVQGPYDGSALRKIREARGLTVEEVSATTKIGQTHLRLIESNSYDRLPAQVYLRGYLLAYARCLRLDPGTVVSSYLEQAQVARTGNGHRG